MRLYLVQHGEATSKEVDRRRPLTIRGRETVDRVASFTARLGVLVSQIRHSGKNRALETAQIFAQHLNPPLGVIETAGLSPMDDVRPLAEELGKTTNHLMLVGHLPSLDRLTSFLVTGDPERSIVHFHMSGVVCLVREDEIWRVDWAITPDIIPNSGG